MEEMKRRRAEREAARAAKEAMAGRPLPEGSGDGAAPATRKRKRKRAKAASGK
jgi:hypothetical protein